MPGHAGTLWVLTCLRVATGERKHLACNAKVEAIEEKATFAILLENWQHQKYILCIIKIKEICWCH